MIKLHHVPQSRSMRVLWLLHEIDTEFEVVTRPFDKSLRSIEYLALHPVGRVPALELDGKAVWESGAMIEILCDRFSPTELGRGLEHPERIDWLIWLHFAESISQHSAALTQQHLVLYSDEMRSGIVMQLEAKRIEKCFSAIDQNLESRDHLLVSGFSAADIAVGQAVYIAKHFARIDRFQNLARWYDTLIKRDGFKKSLPEEQAKLYKQDFYEPWKE
ncbi:glutathione S-transferase [Shimia gijangensis]|uniref:Glutathione S-transferase n=1 Tax=Shimia gijangensis TaxID=1470563 RepID=A0A1M6THZ3_9RHOB|nr:glutathione S-transferase family protein [Shimia gijangensis]SHK56398.1 glutathione S-transferase [Shimia gijangensis]